MTALLAASTSLWIVGMLAMVATAAEVVAMLAAPKVTTILTMILKTMFRLFSTPEESLTQICDFARISLFARSKQFVYQGPGVGVLGQPPGDVVEGEAGVQLCEADGAGHGGRRRTSPLQEEGGDDAVLVHVAQLTEVHQAPLLVDSAQGEDDDHSWRGVGKDCSSGARVD